MLERTKRFAKGPAVYLALLLLLAAVVFGSSRDFASFLFAIPALAILFLGAFVAAVRAAITKAQRSSQLLSWALIGLTPLALLFSYGPVQEIRFLLWAPSHYRQLADASNKNGIILGWDSWGMAGQDTSSYLVVDTEDRLGSQARADQWTHQIGQSCGLWEKRMVWPRLYIVTTFTNCPYDGVEPAN